MYEPIRRTHYPMSGEALKRIIKRRMKLIELQDQMMLGQNTISLWVQRDCIPFVYLVRLKTILDLSPEEIREILAPTLDPLGI